MKLIFLLSAITAGAWAQAPYVCPDHVGGEVNFSLSSETPVKVKVTGGQGDLCTLSIEDVDYIPIARSYDGHDWERSGGSFSAKLDEWTCTDDGVCQATLPKAEKYVLRTRALSKQANPDALVAGFLEAASFGATKSLIENWGSNTFAKYVKDQIAIPGTSHRAEFRTRANPKSLFHKPEFGAVLDPCSESSRWTRLAVDATDRHKMMLFVFNGDRWDVSVDDQLRTSATQIRFKPHNRFQPEVVSGQKYKLCSSSSDLRRGIIKIRVNQSIQYRCWPILTEDLLVDFEDTLSSDNFMTPMLPDLTSTSWQKTSELTPEYVFSGSIPASYCDGLSVVGITKPDIFAKTEDGKWIRFIPRLDLQENTLDKPLADGGLKSLAENKTRFCSNAPRTLFNEHTCTASDEPACPFGSKSSGDAGHGVVVCGSENEVQNDPTKGDTWIQVSSILGRKQTMRWKLPIDNIPPSETGRQREAIWNDIALNANDQLRQRMAWALYQIFALPKIAINAEGTHTEMFSAYYDIFVRNAFGNYRDILREVTYNPLMAESLSYRDNASVAWMAVNKKLVAFPDENFSRELMQLFTIGLVELNLDGTPVLDVDGNPIPTYDSDDIINFARAWTGFSLQPKRANAESGTDRNPIDPMRILPRRRDVSPKADLSGGYIGDGYPLCTDMPERPFLRTGAKYRLLGSSPLPEMVYDDPTKVALNDTKKLVLESSNSNKPGLYEKLCSAKSGGPCTFPSVVVLDENLECNGVECMIDTIRVAKVGEYYFEYVGNEPCVRFPFFEGGIVARRKTFKSNTCVNPLLPVASQACCPVTTKPNLWRGDNSCEYLGERLTQATAAQRCKNRNKVLCDYRKIIPVAGCPFIGMHWTDQSCSISVKINAEGDASIVSNTQNPIRYLAANNPTYFKVYWENGTFPSAEEGCESNGACNSVDGECICTVNVKQTPVFDQDPNDEAEVLAKLTVGHANPSMFASGDFETEGRNGVKVYKRAGAGYDEHTFFEVTDDHGKTKFLKNIRSDVSVGGVFKFRNPPQFMNAQPTEHSAMEAMHETDAVLEHFLTHKNTAPFVAYRLIQRFGNSNPSPRYVKAVASAFQKGSMKISGVQFGSGEYGDLAATVAAVLLDREARSLALGDDPSHGSLREPILKVIALLRSMEFKSHTPLVELDLMDEKIGQMAFEQASVFSFFRPEYSPPGPAAMAQLTAPESEVMTSGGVVGLLNGIDTLVDNGASTCGGFGFGAYGCDGAKTGELTLKPAADEALAKSLDTISMLLTSGRLSAAKKTTILNSASSYGELLKLVATTPEYHTSSKEDPYALAPDVPVGSESINSNANSDYKVVIHIALRGGCDSFNMLAPSDTCGALYDEYKNNRGFIALNSTEVLEVAGDTTGQPCNTFGLHKKLGVLDELYRDGDLMFLANVGLMDGPMNKYNYKQLTKTKLFAHNTMQEAIDILDPDAAFVGTGGLGRMADALQRKGVQTGRVTINNSPTNLAGRETAKSPIFQLGLRSFPLKMEESVDVIESLNDGKSGIYGEAWSEILKTSVDHNDQVHEIRRNATSTTFAEGKISQRFKVLAQLINAREARGVDRDFFTIALNGWDAHHSVTLSLETRFAELNAALKDFVAELKEDTDLWDNVVIVQTSDFGRTITPNAGGGTDHGWGGNYFMAGGKVKGGRIKGTYPSTLDLKSDLLTKRGRVVPTTPWVSVFNAVGEFMGLTEDELKTALPNGKYFTELLSEADLFE